jgi:hypothetical protein
MRAKKYSSYEQIDNDLEILKLEREINYQRIILGVQNTKECITPKHLVEGVLESYKGPFSGPYGKIFNLVIPYITKFLFNKKRGN